MTVADAVQMRRVGEPLYVGYTGAGPKSGFAAFSPDGKRFAIVVTKGNLERNTNDYSLLLYRTAAIFDHAVPKALATFSSASNAEGISDLSWLEDNETVLFLGARGTETTQLYSIRCGSGELKRLTNHKTPLKSYATSASGRTVVYTADKPERGVINESVLQHGFDVTTEQLPDLMTGRITTRDLDLFAKERDAVAESRLRTQGPLDTGVNDLFLSRDGKYLVVKTDTQELKEIWRQYDDETVQTAFRREVPKGSASGLLRYELIDTRTSKSEVLLNSPAPFASSDVLWSPDSQSVLLCGVYLPLDVGDSVELRRRQSTRFVVEIELPSRRIVKIGRGDLRPVRWDSQTNVVQFQVRSSQDQATGATQDIYYQKTWGAWRQLSNVSEISTREPDIQVDEDLNTPPRIVAVDAKTKQEATLLDLNPQFADLQFGRVEQIEWSDGTGKLVSGGLYLPADYRVGNRYPLVIQTHGFDPNEFWIDGPWPTAFAAQPLASRGIVVLQVNDSFEGLRDTPNEAERVMGAYESAIEYLDKAGIIDRAHVGITGFSRTCLYVKYTLTHSLQHFAAAIASDGFDGGYFEYVVATPLAESEMESIAGAAPFGAGLGAWLKNSPGFLLDRVRTPIQLQANAPASLLEQWEWFSGLKRLNKPVDLVYLPTGTHILVKPQDRMVSEEESVDWFCFWLKGEEDPIPEKAKQYARWRELRDRQPETSLRLR